MNTRTHVAGVRRLAVGLEHPGARERRDAGECLLRVRRQVGAG